MRRPMAMKNTLLTLIGLSLLAACAAGPQPIKDVPQGIIFETGKGRHTVMNAILEVGMEDGYTVYSTSEADGTVLFNDRKMLDGALNRRITGNALALQTKRSTLNHLIQFSARVGNNGVVQLKTLVRVSGPGSAIDRDRSEKLARYYKQEIIRFLNRKTPRLLR
jgi:hypothetical protein